MISLIVVLAIAISIFLGYKTKINTGFFAIFFAYFIGCFLLNLKAGEIIAMWPLNIFFIIFAVSLFYNFALVNGTLEKLSAQLLYGCRNFPQMLPFAIFFASTILAGLGAGFFTVMALMAPLTLILCKKTGLHPLLGAIAVNYGALAGANFMTSQSGIIFKTLIESAGFKDLALVYTTAIFITTFILPIIVITCLLFFTSQAKALSNLHIDLPAPFDQKQKTTLLLISLMILIAVVFPVLHILAPQNQTIAFMNSKIDIGLLSITFSTIALLLKLADEKQVIAKVPWNTLIMICGVGMLISVAIKAGTITLLANWISSNIPTLLIPIALCLVGGIMSFFSSTLGVVCPALFPIIPSIAATSDIPAIILFVCVVIGAQATAISPFSSGGSLVLGSCSSDEDRTELFPKLLFRAVPLCLTASVVGSIIVFVIYQ